MKKTIFVFLLIGLSHFADAQFKNLIKNSLHRDSSGKSSLGSVLPGNNETIASGLKEALNKGVESSTSKLSAVDGFFKDAAVKILLPPDAQKVEKALRSAGLGDEVDKAVLTMNRAAEDASKSAAPIFLDAVKQMTITDAVGILKGNDSAATTYLKARTTSALTTAFRPVIDSSLTKVDATKYWSTITTTYNKLPFVRKIETDLTNYVTSKALQGLFHEIAVQEKEIRTNPVARTTDLLKQVFSKQ